VKIRIVNEALTHVALALALALASATSTAFAATFYVSTLGNDNAGNGSVSAPWKTLHKACGTVVAGNVIHVNAGVYTETQRCLLPVGVSLEGEGVASVIKSTWTTSFFAIIELISPEGTSGNQSISNIKFDGNALATPRGIEIGGRSNVSVHDITLVDFKEEGVIFNGAATFIVVPPGTYATGNRFFNNTLTNCSQFSGFGSGCLSIGGQEGMLIYNNTITQPQRTAPAQIGWPIKYYSEGWLKGVKIYNNTLTKAPFNGEGWNFAIELFNQQGLEIYGNTIQGSLDFNYQSKGVYPYSVYIHDNTITQPVFNTKTESGIIIEYGFDGFWIERNVFKNLSTGVSFYGRPDAVFKDFRANANLFADFGTSAEGVGFFIGGLGQVEGSSVSRYYVDGFQVLNNTFIGLASNKPGTGINLGSNQGGYLKNIEVKNNIFQNIVVSSLRVGGDTGITYAPLENLTFTHNNTVNTDQYGLTGNLPYFQNVAPINYVQSNTTHVDPLFAETANYTLSSGSPLINAGINVGRPFAGTAPDVGYFEYGAGANTCNLNINAADGFTIADARTTLAWMLGFRGAALESISGFSGLSGMLIDTFLQNQKNNGALDLDGDNEVHATTDGLMLLRVALGLVGDAVTVNAVNPSGTRNTWMAIRDQHLIAKCNLPL
jgi:Right handed beta helix region